MPIKKSCCCLSLRTGSLVILTFFLIGSVWSMLSLLTTIGNPMYREFLKDNGYIFYTDIFIALIGSLIFLATILSITSNSTTKSLLNVVSAFLLLSVIYNLYTTYLYTSNGVFHEIYNAQVENQAQQLPKKLQVEFRTEMKKIYSYVLGYVYFTVTIHAFIVLYFVLVLRSYLAEVKKTHNGNAPAEIKVKGGANFSAASPNNVQFAVPHHFNQPPQYFVQAASASPQWAQQGVNKSVYPSLQQMA